MKIAQSSCDKHHKRAIMEKLPVKLALALWDEIKKLEWDTDNGLAQRSGISTGTIPHWRKGRTKFVQPKVVKQIVDRLGYIVSLEGNKWQIQKKDELVSALDTANGGMVEYVGGVKLKLPPNISDADRAKYRRLLELAPDLTLDDIPLITSLVHHFGKREKP